MNFKHSIPLILIVAFTLAACSAPLVTPNPPTFQSKVAHVTDWSNLADRTAARFAVSHSHGVPIFVAPGPADMPFAVTYRKLLEQALLQRGFHVVEAPFDAGLETPSDTVVETISRATILRFDVETFLYENRNCEPAALTATLYGNRDCKPVPVATAWAAATAVAMELVHVSSWDTGAAIVGGAGPVLDILRSLYDTTKAEVLLTVSAYDGTRLEYRDSEAIYVHPSELNFYWTRFPDISPQMKVQPVTEVSLPVR